MKLALLFLFLSGCTFESVPDLTCSWIPDGGNGIPLCNCGGRQPYSVAEIKAACCAAPDAPEHLCQEAPPGTPSAP